MNRSGNSGEGWRWNVPAITFGLASVAGVALVAIYFWQIFVTMPHLARFYRDTGAYLDPIPLRGPGLYSFIKLALLFWNDFYAVAVAQDFLLASSAALLACAMWRLTRSPLLMLTPLLVCLFKVTIIIDAQGLNTGSLFAILCIGLMACALLLYENVSPWRIGGFLLFGFSACFVRSVGEAFLWSLVLVLALRLWPKHRRALGVLAAGCLGVHVLMSGISYVNYGIWVPQAQLGQVLMFDAAFIADENAPPGAGSDYPRDFIAATASLRAEYRKAATWAEKYEVRDRYVGPPILKIALDTVVRNANYTFDRQKYDKFDACGPHVGYWVMRDEALKHAALTIIRENPVEYMKMGLVNLMAGVHMFTSYSDGPLKSGYGQDWADHMRGLASDYMSASAHPEMSIDELLDDWRYRSLSIRPELVPLVNKLVDDWQNASFDLKYDIARPLRAFFSLGDFLTIDLTRSPLRSAATPGGTLNWLFIIESVVVLVLTVAYLLRRQPIGDRLGVLLLLIVPTWGYLVVLCLLTHPYGVYMDATSSFVYIALLTGAWTVVTTAVKKSWVAVSKTWINGPIGCGSIVQAQ